MLLESRSEDTLVDLKGGSDGGQVTLGVVDPPRITDSPFGVVDIEGQGIRLDDPAEILVAEMIEKLLGPQKASKPESLSIKRGLQPG